MIYKSFKIMATKVTIPAMGESISSGTLAAWNVKDGDYVEEGQAIYELETDKITSEANAEVSGTIKIKVAVDEALARLVLILHRLVCLHDHLEGKGRLAVAKVDVDANPQLAQGFRAQSIPMVVALLAGQPVPLFQGAVPEQQVREVFAQLLQAAAQNGVTGTITPEDAPDGGRSKVINNPIILRGAHAPVEEPDAYASLAGKLVAIGEIAEGQFKPRRVFG